MFALMEQLSVVNKCNIVNYFAHVTISLITCKQKAPHTLNSNKKICQPIIILICFTSTHTEFLKGAYITLDNKVWK